MRLAAFALIAAALGSAVAHAEDGKPGLPAGDLRDMCEEKTGSGPSLCRGYIWGVADAAPPSAFCVRKGVSAYQVGEVVRTYLVAHPETWDRPAHNVAVEALGQAFPCEQKPRRK